MSRLSLDAHRSIKKFVVDFMPDDWDIQLNTEDVTDRPGAAIQYAGPQVLTGGPKVFDVVRPFVIYAWPEKQDSASRSLIEAEGVEEMFIQAFQIGHGVEGTGPQGPGRPRRIPLWDYAGVDIQESLPDGAEPDGYLRMIDFSTESREDGDDPRLFTVIARLRVTWRRLGEPKFELLGNEITGLKIGRDGTEHVDTTQP